MIRNPVPVDVISMCSASGQIQPLRFRMEDESHHVIKGNICQIIDVKDIHYVGVEAQVFLCLATVEERDWLFELKYMIRTHCWYILNFGIENCRQMRYNGFKYKK